MGNYRAKLSRAGFQEVAVNARKRNDPNKQSPPWQQKTLKGRSYSVKFPMGWGWSQGKWKESCPDYKADVLRPCPATQTDHQWWPPRSWDPGSLACSDNGVLGKNLSLHDVMNHFYAVLDQHAPPPTSLQSFFRKKAARTGKVSDVLSQLFRTYDLQVSAFVLSFS